MINRNNYIEFIVDFYDGKLSEPEKKALIDFLSIHANIRKEFEDYGESFDLNNAAEIYAPKSLKHKLLDIPETEFKMSDEWLVAFSEGDLVGKEEEKVRSIIESDIYWSREHRTMAATRISPDRSIVFPNKQLLMHNEKSGSVRRFIYIATAAAAALVISYLLWSPSQPRVGLQNNNSVAQIDAKLPHVTTINNDTTKNFPEKFYNIYNNLPENNIANNLSNTETSISLMNIKTASQLAEKPIVLPAYLNDKRTEYISIYEYSELRLAMNNQSKEKKGETFSDWKDWGLALVSGNGSVKDNPVSDITFREVTSFGFNTLNNFTEKNMSFAIKK